MAFTLFPKSIRFFDLLIKQNAILQEVAGHLGSIFGGERRAEEAFKAISLKEGEGDELSREISRQLCSSFITPIDREDIYRINLAQEDSINLLKSIATRTYVSGFSRIRFPARKMVENISRMAALTGRLIAALQSRAETAALVRQGKDLKEECGMLLTTGLSELQDATIVEIAGVVEVIKWVQVYDRIEQVSERLDDLIEAIEEVVMKNA